MQIPYSNPNFTNKLLFSFCYRGICIVDNDASIRRTLKTLFFSTFVYLHKNYDRKFKDKPNCNEKYTKKRTSIQTARKRTYRGFIEFSEVYMARLQNYEYILIEIFITCGT